MEIFEDISGYEGLYQVSDLGNVKSLNYMHTKKEQLLKFNYSRGYFVVTLYYSGTPKRKLVHRIIAETFLPNTENKPQVNHKNGIKTDNRLENLEWNTNSENQLHAYRQLGRRHSTPNKGRFGKDSGKSEKINQYTKYGEFVREWDCAADAKREIGIPDSNICSCVKGRLKTAGGYKRSKKL